MINGKEVARSHSAGNTGYQNSIDLTTVQFVDTDSIVTVKLKCFIFTTLC